MRIISGTARGRKLCPPPLHDRSIRPTSDRARESLFNIIGKRVAGSRVLDLFAGTGAFGLEALSRKARLVVFVDFSPLSLKLIKKNIHLCRTHFPEGYAVQVIKHDLTKNLPISKFSTELFSGFDLIFMDPPYGRNISLSTLDFLNKSSLLTSGGLLVVEERHNIELPREFSTFHCRDKRIYGKTSFYFYRRSNTI